LVFTHAASVFREAAVNVIEDSNVLLDDCLVVWNGQNGLALTGEGLTVRDSKFDHNGSSGLTGFKVVDVRVVGSEASSNNWRGVRAGYTGWEVGQKFSLAHAVTFTGFTSTGNQSRGLWFDTDVSDVVVEDSRICGNLLDGLFVEKVQGPVVVTRTAICDNGRHGILTSAAQGLEILDSTITANHQSQLAVSGDLDVKVVSWLDATHLDLNSAQWKVEGNVVSGDGGQYLVSTTLPRSYWDRLIQSSLFANNEYEQTQLSRPFEVQGGRRVNFEEWGKLTGELASSSFRP